MNEEDANTFLKSYRNSLKNAYDTSVANIENTNRLENQQIMSNANMRGALYSNLPQRQKIQYQTSTYMPSLAKAQNTYQTGLNTLRNNELNYLNKIKSLDEAIADLNKNGITSTSTLNREELGS